MKARDITEQSVREYLDNYGVDEGMLFGSDAEKIDPIDRHVVMRDLFENFSGFRMEHDGLTAIIPVIPPTKLVVDNMRDFEQVNSIKDAITTMKYLCYLREAKVVESRMSKFDRGEMENDLER